MMLLNTIPTRKEIENIPVYVPGKPIEEVQRELGLTKVFKLASNENPLGLSPLAKEAMLQEIGKTHLYPEGMAPELARKLAGQLEINEEQIIIGNGSDEIIRLLTRSYIRPGDEAVMADVTFPRYETNVLIEGGNPIKVPLVDGVHDLKAMHNAITERTRIIFICNPNNPTGTIVDNDKLQAFIESVPKNILLVMDEAYYEYVTIGQHLDTTKLLHKCSNLVILRTFSKIHGLAALRVGYGMMHPSIIRELVKVKEPFNTNRLAQAAAVASLDDVKFIEMCRRENDEGRKYLETELTNMGLSFFPSQANFVMIKVNRSGNDIFEALLRRGIIIRPGELLGYPETIRVSIGTQEGNQEFMSALREILGN